MVQISAFCSQAISRQFSIEVGYTVVAILLDLPADMVTVLVCLHLRRLTYTGAAWLRSENSVASVIRHLLLHNCMGSKEKPGGLPSMVSSSTPIKVLLGQGDVIMVWQKDDSEWSGGTAHPPELGEQTEADRPAVKESFVLVLG